MRRFQETCLATAQVPPDVYKEKVVDIFIRLGPLDTEASYHPRALKVEPGL